jgi:branched-chain amino acid aminotransferase
VVCFGSDTFELADIDWDDLGFAYVPTDYMYSMKCTKGGNFSKGELQRYGNIELNPSAGVLNYGQVFLSFIYLFFKLYVLN